MLRRVILSRPSPVAPALIARHFSSSSPLLQSGSGKKFIAEDQEDLERERRLREQFAQKIHQNTGGAPQGSSSSSSTFTQSSTSASSDNSSSFVPPNLPFNPPGWKWMVARLQKLEQLNKANVARMQASRGGGGAGQEGQQQQQQQVKSGAEIMGPIGRILFFSLSIVMMVALLQLNNPNSVMNLLAGVPWYEGPPDTVACFMLCRALLPVSEQNTIRNEYALEVAKNPGLSFATFIWQRYPNRFNGNRVQQQQLISGLCAAVTAAPDLNGIRAAVATGRGLATPDAADRIYEALRSAYPQCFVSASPPSQVTQFAPIGQPQQMQQPSMMMMMQPPAGMQGGFDQPVIGGDAGGQQYQFSSSFVMDDPAAAPGSASTMKSDI